MPDFERWIEAYQAAARSDDPAAITALFTEDAEYHGGPYEPPARGREQILQSWLEESDAALEWEFDYERVAVDGARAVFECEYRYTSPEHRHTYRNLWVIELDEQGRARLFKDYWVEDPATRSND